MNPDDTLTKALEDIAKKAKEKEAADKAAAEAKLDELSKDLFPPPGNLGGTTDTLTFRLRIS
jgi:hypothetical protein